MIKVKADAGLHGPRPTDVVIAGNMADSLPVGPLGHRALDFNYLVADHNCSGFGNATILLYLAVTCSVQRAARPGSRAAGRRPGSGRPDLVRLITPDGAQPG